MMKWRPFFFTPWILLMGTALKAAGVCAAEYSPPEERTRMVQAGVGVGKGYESNVFSSEDHPQPDTFLFSDATFSAAFKPKPTIHIFADFFGSYQHFETFNKADRVFSDLVLDAQFLFTSTSRLGLSNTLSHANLKLFDTEGNALPREQFRSLSDRIRLYGQFFPAPTVDLELGGSYRVMNFSETEDRPPYNLPSLDFKEIAADLSSRYFLSSHWSTRLKYEFSVLLYDELQANNRNTSLTGAADADNPELRLQKHELSANLKYKRESLTDFELAGKLRINQDQFEEDLDYHQGEIKGKITTEILKTINLSLEVSYRSRTFAVRRKKIGSDTNLMEGFLTAGANINRNITRWLQAYVKYQWISRTSNSTGGEFNDHIGMVGFRLIL